MSARGGRRVGRGGNLVTRVTVAAIGGVAGVTLGCNGGELWSFDSSDASAPSTVGSVVAEAGSSEGGSSQGPHLRDAAALGMQCDYFNNPYNCFECTTDDNCPQGRGALTQCGIEKRCVECTTYEVCNPDPDAGTKSVCVDEHCVPSCTGNRDCSGPGCSNRIFMTGADAGYCVDCNPFDPNPGGSCNSDGIGVECLGNDFCNPWVCSPNGYCEAPDSGTGSRDN